MSARLGISILDLLPQTTQVALQIPDDIVEKIGVLTVLEHRATTSPDFFLHEGTLQALDDALGIDSTSWPVRIPGFTHGLPFRMAVQRVAPAGGQEGTPALWTLDIEVRDVEIEIPGVVAAHTSGGAGVTPLTLQPVNGTANQRRVFLVARGVVRVSGGGPGGTQVQIVDTPDPFDPNAPTGAVIRLTAKPPHFLFGGSRYGMTLDQFVLDLSRTYTPPEIVAREHDEAWEGVAFRETTFYLPPDTPLFHSLSVSARDVVLGDPGGLQGELRLEFGEDFNDIYNTRIAVKLQQAGGGETDLPASSVVGTALEFATPAGQNGAPQRVKAVFQVGAGELIPGHVDLAAVGVWWKLPDGREGNDATTPWFDAPTTGVLHYRLRLGNPSTASNTASSPSGVPTDQTELVEVRVRFPRQAGSPSGAAPVVDALIDGTTYNNVLHLRGPRTRIVGAALSVRGGGHANWQVGNGSAPTTARDTATFTMPLLAQGAGTLDVTVADDNGTRRIRVEVVPQGPLAVGHQSTAVATSTAVVTVVGTGDATPTDVTDTFTAVPFHVSGQRPTASSVATISGTQVTVPQGADAEVEVPIPGGANDPLPVITPPTNDTPTVTQVLYNWDESVPQRLVYPYDGPADAQAANLHEPDALPMASGNLQSRRAPDGTDVTSRLRQWLADLPPANGRKFFIIGRTDDLKFAANEADNNTYNDGLATARANAAKEKLIAAGADESTIQPVVCERIGFASAPDGNPPARFINGRRLALPLGHVKKPPGANSPVWNERWNPDSADLNSSTHASAKADPNRPPYRCAEIYVVDTGAPPPPPPPPPPGAGVPTRMLVPGPDGPPAPGVVSTTAATPPTDYRVRLRVKWDSPTVVTLADAIPTEAEALIAWKKAQVELPPTASGTAPPVPPPPTGPDYWELLLRWAYDSRTGETEASGALSLPDGTLTWQSDALAGALAFGPAITALADPADAIKDPVGQFVAAAAILAVGAAIGELINTGGGPESTVDIDKFAISYKWDGASHGSATLDYTVDLRVNISVAGSSLIGHLRLRYKGVGLRFDGKPGGGLAGVALTYDSMSVEVVDPGTWSLGGPLGNLIRIAASRMGNGSQWMEFDLEFALDLGVVRLEGATIRLGLDPFSVEFRGLTASVDIPATLKGKGSVTIGDGGSFRALLALEVIPAKLSAYGALAVDQDFVAVEVGVQLPVGIPLGGTGFGIFGFMGRFVANGTRNLEGLSNPDPVQKQLDWYVRSPQDKYARKSGQFAFGVGAVIGTLPDGGFTFNAEGSLAIGFPDVSVVFGIDAHLITQRKSQATESGTSNASSFRILGMVLIDETSIMVAVRASYEIPKVLKLQIPISAYFPLAGGDAWYIRIGTDNDATRPGSPVTITLLPGLLDVRAWAFVMIEERKLHHLGGTIVPLDLAQPLDFDGFSIGTGAGFDLKYSAGPFKLEISAFLLVGIGTKPLLFAGAAGIKGELDLVIISVGIDGLIHFHISPGYSFVEGHFCGHIDFFFFTVSGCVDIRIGDDPPSNIPAPDSPIAGMDLCDHLAAVKGKASRVDADAVPTVWPDTVAVLRFAHYIEDGLGAAADFDRKLPSPAALSPWSGTTELKYAFRLETVELWKLTGNDPSNAGDWTQVHGPFDSAWWMPTHRAGIIEGGDTAGPSTEEGRELGLFSTDPRAWSRWLGEGTQNVPGDPANTVGKICDPVEPADPSCAFGRDRFFVPNTLGGFKAVPDAGAAIPSRFTVFATLGGGLDAATAASLGADAGWNWIPGAVAPLHGPALVHGTTLTQGWRFPAWRSMSHIVATAPISFGLSKPLLQGELVLEYCGERVTTPPDTRQCDPMPAQDGTITAFGGPSGAKYEGPSMRCISISGERALVLTQGSMYGVYPSAAASVSVDVDPRAGRTELVAMSSTGATLGHAITTSSGRQWLTIEAAGIAQISIKGSDQPTIFEVCWGTAATPAILQLVHLEQTTTPRVIAYDIDGNPTPLTGTVQSGGAQSLSALAVVSGCPKFVFPLPKGKGWTRVEVSPWLRGDVTLVSLCGVTLEAAAAQAADGDYRAALKDLLLELAQDAVTDTPTHDVYLDADDTYEIRVGWQWQGVRPTNGAEPAPPAAANWTDAAVERFRFSTAAFQLADPPAPVENTSLDVDPAQGGPGYDERGFDPRGLARYLTRAAPSHEDPPHFLDDHAGFWFMVDHLEKLVEKYDRILQVKVLHTRPDAGSLHGVLPQPWGSVHILDVTTGVNWQIDTLSWTPADFRLVEAAVAAPCIGVPPALGSSSVSVTADLEPHSEYDLLLNTAPKTVGAFPEVQVARSHFRTSRYHNPTGLLRALGFELPMALGMPTDAIATAPLASGALEIGDTELDAALTTLGLDPWPLPAAPRTSVIWLAPASVGQPWQIAAVLVEADEPVWRAGFKTGAYGETEPPPRLEVQSMTISRTYEQTVFNPFPFGKFGLGGGFTTVTKHTALGTLSERVRNTAGTRSIFVPAAPITMTGGRLYDIAIQFLENGSPGASGSAPVLDRPLMIAEEGGV